MVYFSRSDFLAVKTSRANTSQSPDFEQVYEKFSNLYEALNIQIRNQNLVLATHHHERQSAIQMSSIISTQTQDRDALVVDYARPVSDAIRVERLMGRDEVSSKREIEIQRHPAIELRITPEHLTLELILSIDAWWDQENLVGKLTVERHRLLFYKMLRELDGAYYLGFWRGTQLSEMHVSAKQFQYNSILDEWLGTFEPRKDWFRLGIWYEPEADELEVPEIHTELFKQVKALFSIYHFLLWSSENNYRDFFHKQSSAT